MVFFIVALFDFDKEDSELDEEDTGDAVDSDQVDSKESLLVFLETYSSVVSILSL